MYRGPLPSETRDAEWNIIYRENSLNHVSYPQDGTQVG